MAVNPLAALAGEFKFSSPVFRHALRAALAITVAIALAKGLGLAHSVWVPVSVLVVMRPSLGGTLHISRRRLAGTAMGAAAGVLVAWMHLPVPAVAVLVLLFSFLIFYFKAVNYTQFTASLTFVLVVILGAVFSHTWQGGAERVFDTVLGICIGLAASFMIWPNFARKHLRQEMGRLIAVQHSHFTHLRRAYFSHDPDTAGLVSGRIAARTLLESCVEKFSDASIEPGLRASQRQELMHLGEVFTRIHRTLTVLSGIVGKSTGVFHGSVRPEFELLMDELDLRFAVLEAYARTGEIIPVQGAFHTRVGRFMAFLGGMRAQGKFDGFSLDRRNNSAAFIRQINRLGTDLEAARNGIEALRN